MSADGRTNPELIAALEQSLDTTRTIASVLWNRNNDVSDEILRLLVQVAFEMINSEANDGLSRLNYLRVNGILRRAEEAGRAALDGQAAGPGEAGE